MNNFVLSISYCGRVGSFSHEAAMKMFPNAMYLSYNTFTDAITAVELSDSHYAVIPIENSTAGRVAEIHNLLPTLNLRIVQEKIIRISHNLYTISDDITLDDIRIVESHPQALMQCSKFLATINAQQRDALNTAIAAENLMKTQNFEKAVVCSRIAGDIYKLHLLAEGIQNTDDNYTTFIAVGQENTITTFKYPLTSIIFALENKTGGIYEALGCFARNSINLLKLESYIPAGSPAKCAQFFLTFEGANSNENVKKAFKQLAEISKEIKNLGTYEADSKRFS